MTHDPVLLVIPNLQAVTNHEGRVFITQKFLEGVTDYTRLWPGPVRVSMGQQNQPTGNLDERPFNAEDWPFTLNLHKQGTYTDQDLKAADLVLAGIGYGHDQLPRDCAQHNKPCVLITEYTSRTRRQMILADAHAGWLRKLRRLLWDRGQEQRNRNAVRQAAGVQCNGTPTYRDYQPLNPNTITYFDTRFTSSMVRPRTRTLPADGRPLQLAFSGRLIDMKGARHLVPIASILRDRGVGFQLHVFGDGPCKPVIEQDGRELIRSGHLLVRGVVPFNPDLVDIMQNEIDLFVCPHLQGDPSCTYAETISCGVPIAGYPNEAWAGMCHAIPAGSVASSMKPSALADQIIDTLNDPDTYNAQALACQRFNEHNTFEQVSRQRVDHMIRTLRQHQQDS
ncbi:glycosyltransferase [Mucisphaera calidilacus]|uniref:2-deoxystreptamine glucosyltransferase n=1 Tax=Mucisphaera calidilacus TaxID=2527982 RepID=A0A518BTE2_9BACT|nr:glycosyltransferase [Mucisphaera calidilacus]QDU70225.1 2-deoxystreptamine glucosyltransferase [Mucisphaera calidilacus]